MTSGNPELIALIRSEIEERGPISFARFMERALYHPQHGFYASGRAKLGRAGDYFTNVSVGPAFGQLVAQQLIEMWQTIGAPPDFVIVEQGAHHGDFARDLLQWLSAEHSDFFAALRYRIIEPWTVLQERQRETLADYCGKVDWVAALSELSSFRGVFFANELLDAFPVHCLCRRQDAAGEWIWLEKFVDADGEGFVFVEKPISAPALVDYASAWPKIEGAFEAEVSLGVQPWLGEVSSKLREGFVLLIDYGFSIRGRFAAERAQGTLQVRQRHRLLDSAFLGIGEADITAHVDWDWLTAQAPQCGLKIAGMADQHHFLAGILARDHEFMGKASPKIRREVQTLLHPEMLGRSFQAVILSRNIPDGTALSGLKFAAGC